MCHMSGVRCQVSGVRCHMSGVPCHFFFLQNGGACRGRVCYQRGLPRLVPMLSGFPIFRTNMLRSSVVVSLYHSALVISWIPGQIHFKTHKTVWHVTWAGFEGSGTGLRWFPSVSLLCPRKVREGSEYMSEHTSEVRGRVLGGGVHASESKS